MFKRVTLAALILATLAATAAVAEPIEGMWLFTPSLGYTFMTSNEDDASFNGMGVSGTIERIAPGGFYALGLSVGYLWSVDEVTVENEKLDINHSSIPALLTLNFMGGGKRVSGHIGFGAGIHYSKTDSDASWKEDTRTEFAMSVPLGLMIWVTENININVNYRFYRLFSSYLMEDSLHMADVGIGFQF